jgi:type IV secretory pathway VirB10-like protein
MHNAQFTIHNHRAHRLRTVRFWICALCLVHSALLAGACAKARAESAPDGPPLSVPEPPARVLMPIEEPLPAAAIATEVPPVTAPRPPARQPVRRPNGGAAEPETRPEPAPPAATTAPPAQPPAPALRATPSAAEAAAERTVRETLSRATRDLSRVDYGRLSTGGRSQYEQSKRFTEQAEQAIKDRNFPFAATLADKAATLAQELLGSR